MEINTSENRYSIYVGGLAHKVEISQRDYILSLTAGALVDGTIDREVFGVDETTQCWSSDIAAAFDLIFHLQQSGRWYFKIDSVVCGGWYVEIHDERAAVKGLGQTIRAIRADDNKDIPLAICKGALLIKLHEQDRRIDTTLRT